MIVLPEYLLFAQHGWADTNSAMADLAQQVTGDHAVHIEAPNLSYVQTWLSIKPLIRAVEILAINALSQFPGIPIRVIGHSMGGLIWLEVLHRHPNWWPQLEFLVLLASPVGGADLGRIFDPLQVGLGIAADLGINRRPLAEELAAQRPTLVIAGDVDNGSDGTIPVESTKVNGAQFLRLEGLSHPQVRNHPAVAEAIREFWQGRPVGETLQESQLIRQLRQVSGMTDGHARDLLKARIAVQLSDGNTLRVWRNPFGVFHLYVVSAQGRCIYSGFLGWIHEEDLWRLIRQLQATTQDVVLGPTAEDDSHRR